MSDNVKIKPELKDAPAMRKLARALLLLVAERGAKPTDERRREPAA